jgi:cation diffusion facilitator family transporter
MDEAKQITAKRLEANHLKEHAAVASIAASACLTLAKLIAGITSGSLALISEAGHNLADTGMTIMTFFAIRIAKKPADEDHPYGHGKVEALAALFETGLLFALSVFILGEAVRRFVNHDVDVDPNPLAFGVLIVSIAIDIMRWISLSRIAHRTKSDALAADALHFSSDIFASALALCGLVAASYGHPEGDAVAAFAVALFIAVAGYRLGRRTIDTLLDAAPKGLTAQVRAVAAKVPGVIDVPTLRLRPAGAEILGDIDLAIPRTLPLAGVAAIKENVKTAISAAHPDVSITISTRPVALDDETILERLLLIAAKRHLPIHHVTVQEIDGRTSVSFDVELDGQMRHGYAHEIVSGLEIEVRKEFGPDMEVESHIEPLEPRELPGQDASPAVQADIAAALTQRSLEQSAIHDVHSVRVRQTPAGLVINYHCRVDPDLSVDEVHEQVDDLERKVRDDFPAIVRIVGHAEPKQDDDDVRRQA